MDRSYRIKLQNKLDNGALDKYTIVSCIAKIEPKISKYAYNAKRFKDCTIGLSDSTGELKKEFNENRMEPIRKLQNYRQPFIEVLTRKYRMSLDDIKISISEVRQKDIPTNNIIDSIRQLIVSGQYTLTDFEHGNK